VRSIIMPNNLSLGSQIQKTHSDAVQNVKKTLLDKASQQVDFSNDKLLVDRQSFDSLDEAKKRALASIQASAKEKVLEAYNAIIESMANEHLRQPQSKEFVTKAQQALKGKLKLIKSELVSKLKDSTSTENNIAELHSQALDKISKQLGESLVGFGPAAINTYKAKHSLHHEQLENKKRDAHFIATIFDPKTFSPDPMNPVDYDYKIDIDKLRLHIKHSLANLKPGEKLRIEVEIPPDRADILKRVAENGFQYKINLVALLLLFYIQIKMINHHDETRTASAIKALIEKDHIPLRAEDIEFSIKARGNDGKMRTVLEPRPLDPAIAKWKLGKPLQSLYNILYPAANSKKRIDEPVIQENELQPNCREEAGTALNDSSDPRPSLML
jgi:hypothetical protein